MNTTLTREANPTIVQQNTDSVGVFPSGEGGDPVSFTSVKIDFQDVFDANECVPLTVVYNGVFSEDQLSEGFVAVKAGNNDPVESGEPCLPLLLCGAVPITCPDECPDCTEREIPFTCELALPDLVCSLTPITVVFEGFCPSLSCTVEQCQAPVELPVCPGETLVCCITLDNITVTGTIDLIFDVLAELQVECPQTMTLTKDFLCFETINISQVCFECENNGECPEDFCDLFDVTFTSSINGTLVLITGTVTFNCP
ncbi:MAG: hypothetical protein ACE3JP_12360 [Ectobacillus sp.]